MKQLNPNGSVSVVSQPRGSRGRKFDSWPSHAVTAFGVGSGPCASGRIITGMQFTLKNGQVFIYPTLFCPDFPTASVIENYFKNFQSANNYVGFFGEWYNFQFRALAFDKVLAADWNDWLDTH